jgi:hypothetical protein
MGKVANFFKAIPSAYYDWRKRNEKIDALINNHNSTLTLLTSLQDSFNTRTNELRDLQNDVRTIIGLLDTVKNGTKMELFETLHNWRELLVVRRGWASPEEKKEVMEIYTIYHDKLNGNGNGERYYKEIIALPESLEELEARKQQGRS